MKPSASHPSTSHPLCLHSGMIAAAISKGNVEVLAIGDKKVCVGMGVGVGVGVCRLGPSLREQTFSGHNLACHAHIHPPTHARTHVRTPQGLCKLALQQGTQTKRFYRDLRKLANYSDLHLHVQESRFILCIGLATRERSRHWWTHLV